MLYPKTKPGRVDEFSLLAGLLLGVIAFGIMAQSQADFRPDEVGLGEETSTHLSDYRGHPVAGFVSTPEEVHATLGRIRAQGRPSALWLGASQLHAINRIRPGEELAVFHANESASRRGAELGYAQLSAPNANLNELLVAYLEVRAKGLLPDLLILGLTYDDLREPGIRATILERAPQSPGLDIALSARGGLENIAALIVESESAQRQAVEVIGDMQDTPQQRLEERLTELLEQYFPAYRHRGKLLASAEVEMLEFFFRLRNLVADTRIPPIPQPQKIWNLAALDTLLELALRDGLQVLVYKAPHRPGAEGFYHDRRAYDRFFKEREGQFGDLGVGYVDLEEIVAAEQWGFINSGVPDFFHFRGEGHELLGRHVDAVVAGAGF